MIDEWCSIRLPEGRRARGRLIQTSDNELVLFQPNQQFTRFGVTAVDPQAKSATTEDGVTLKWMHVCTCGQPPSLKGNKAKLLAVLG